MFEEEQKIEDTMNVRASGLKKHLISIKYWGLRQCIASGAWIANDFAFYGNKLFQGVFISILYPKVGAAHSTFIVFGSELLAVILLFLYNLLNRW